MYNDSNRWSYQKNAIEKISRFFSKDELKKGLLVIPTGGGKTLTALRAINELYRTKVISKKVLWISHLRQLNIQTKNVIKKQLRNRKFLGNLEDIHINFRLVTPCMKSEAKLQIKNNKTEYDLVVIDEAHHAAADDYRLIVGSSLPLLGLTATPTRLDSRNLPFDEIIFQVSPSELFRRGVIIRPTSYNFETNFRYELNNISDDNAIDIFNNTERNSFIVDKIFDYKTRFSKVIVFVRTQNHARDLSKAFKQKNFGTKYYEKIGYILGSDQNDEMIKNEDYLNKNKNYDRSIIVNCGVLTEGFDDPSINTTVLACPSKSTTFLMQCVGRALRRNQQINDDEQKKAYVNFSDDLPNVNYRFDNFWTFGELDDKLEPNIKRIEYDSFNDFKLKLNKVISEKPHLYNFCKEVNFKTDVVKYEDLEDSSLLLYNYSAEDYGEKWGLIYMCNYESKNFYLDKFNSLSIGVDSYERSSINIPVFLGQRDVKNDDQYLGQNYLRQNFWDSILKSSKLIKDRGDKKEKINRIEYYTFLKIEDLFRNKLKLFVSECVNKDEIDEKLKKLDNEKTYWLIILPFTIIGGYEWRVIDEDLKEKIIDLINHFKLVTLEKEIYQYKILIENKRENFKDIDNNQISYEQILQIINDKNKIYSNENTFLKIHKK